MRYIGLDVSYRNVGVVMLDAAGDLLSRVSLVCSATREPDGFAWHRQQADGLFLPDDVVAIEGQSFGSFTFKSMIAGSHAVWLDLAVQQSSLVFVPTPMRVKMWATGKGKATKAQIKAWARTQLALTRKQKLTEHEADALALAWIARSADRVIRKRYVDLTIPQWRVIRNKDENGVTQVLNQSMYRGFYGKRYEDCDGFGRDAGAERQRAS